MIGATDAAGRLRPTGGIKRRLRRNAAELVSGLTAFFLLPYRRCHLSGAFCVWLGVNKLESVLSSVTLWVTYPKLLCCLANSLRAVTDTPNPGH
jgi:hypothetical protein